MTNLQNCTKLQYFELSFNASFLLAKVFKNKLSWGRIEQIQELESNNISGYGISKRNMAEKHIYMILDR